VAERWGGRRVQEFTAAVLATWGTVCHLCGNEGADTADHLIPRSKGGSWWSLDNARPAHQPCNAARCDRDLAVWFATHPLPGRPMLDPSREW
jgi:5-methylcytosine-specific restriction endonuclease McrA